MKFAVCVLTALWRQRDMAGRKWSCVQRKLSDRVPSASGQFRRVCAVILPWIVAPCSCKNIRPQAEVQRSSLDEACRTSSPGLEDAYVVERAQRWLCVYTDHSNGLTWSPWCFQVCWHVLLCRSGPWTTCDPWAHPCAFAEHHVKPPSTSQGQNRESCLLFLSC